MTSAGQRKSSISTSGPGVGVSTKASTSRFPTGKSAKPELSVQADNTWKDMVRHEKLVIKLWNWKWDFLLPPQNRPNFRRASIDEELRQEGKRLGLLKYQEYESRDYDLKPSPKPFPLKSSEWIGWRGKEPKNSFDFYRTRSDEGVPKRRFVKEQYGFYRQLKYLTQNVGKAKGDSRASSTSLPTKRIRHSVNPLLC